jgi:hypothetical protein
MAQKQYANIELFKIPDIKFKRYKKKTTPSLNENASGFFDSRFESWGRKESNDGDDNSDPDPEQIV